MENPIKMDDLGRNTLFLETPIYLPIQIDAIEIHRMDQPIPSAPNIYPMIEGV